MRKTIREAVLAEVKAARAIAEAAETENRELTTDEEAKIQAHLKAAADKKAAGEKEDAARKSMDDIMAGIGLGTDPDTGEQRSAGIYTPSPDKAAKSLSIGGKFINSPEFKAMLASAPNGAFSEKMRVQSAPYAAKELVLGADHDTNAGVLVQPDYRGMLDPFYQRPLTVRQLVTNGQTTSDTIEYVRMDSVTNRAAPVPEATSTAPIDGTTVTDAAGGLKPESGMTFSRDSTTVKTIAHWIPATKRALSDAAQVRTLIDSFLRYGLEEEVEDQMVGGDGVGENFRGLANTPGIQTQAAPGAGQDVFDVLRMARRKVRIGGRANPTAYVMNPIDWEDIELRRNANNEFYGAGPFAMTTPRVWGLPVVESEAVTPGTAWVADWSFAVLYDREQASIQVTDSHADFFVRNLVVILAELRAAFAVLRPAAFVRVTLA